MLRAAATLLAAAVLAAAAAPASAHHSGAMFDQTKTVTLTGAVMDYKWVNPHTLIEMIVTDPAGKQVVWNVECSTPNILVRKGWAAHSLKPGDAITMTAHPTRDGSPAALVMAVTVPGGAVLKDHDY
jgi:hypothetical protein